MVRSAPVRFGVATLALALASCGYSADEYAINRSALAPGAAIVGGPVKDINPVNGEIVGTGASARSLTNPLYQRYDPKRLMRD